MGSQSVYVIISLYSIWVETILGMILSQGVGTGALGSYMCNVIFGRFPNAGLLWDTCLRDEKAIAQTLSTGFEEYSGPRILHIHNNSSTGHIFQAYMRHGGVKKLIIITNLLYTLV